MAIEERLNRMSRDQGIDIMRLRRHVAFDRFLARLFLAPVAGLVAKGGYVLELRMRQARLTKDIDFSFFGNLGGVWDGNAEGLQNFFQNKMASGPEDFFSFVIGNATLDLENAPYGGFRFPVEARMAGRKFVSFTVDIAAGDAWFEPHDMLPTSDWLGFAGIQAVAIPAICIEQQFAEKLHSYTQLRDYQNSRIKDLVDMVLIISRQTMSRTRLAEIVRTTFAKRNDSVFPAVFNDPPENWPQRYSYLARECEVEEDIGSAIALVRGYCLDAGIIQQG